MSASDAELGPEVAAADREMPAEFGLGTATFVVFASMVGVGILTTSGFTVDSVGSNQLMILLWLVGGIAALSAALTLSELSAMMPKAGGEYVILYEAYGPLAGFLSGWVTVLLGFAAPVAASASACASYLLKPWNLPDSQASLATQGLGTVAILIFTTIHTMGRSQSARVQVSITLVKLGTLLVFLVAGLVVGWPHLGNLNDRPPIDGTRVSNMLFSLVYIAYGYFGWNAASYLAGEVRDPGRTLPRAIGLGTGLVILLYLGLNTVYAMALPAAEIQQIAATKGKGAIAPIAELAAERLFGSRWASALSVTVGLMLLSTLSAYVLTGPRVAYAMARAGQFPAVAGRLSRRFQTPAVATGVLASLALILLWTGSFNSIVIYASVGMSLFSILTIGAVYVLRWRRPDWHRPFRTPGYPVVPAIYMLVSAALSIATAVNSPRVSLYSLTSMVAGVPLYYVWRLTLGRKPPGPIEADQPVSV